MRKIGTILISFLFCFSIHGSFSDGMSKLQNGNLAAAQAAFEKVIQSNNRYLPAYAYLAYVLYQRGDYTRVVNYFPGAIRSRLINLSTEKYKKEAVMVLKYIGAACLQIGQSKKGIVAFTIANKIIDNDPKIYNYLGLAYLKTGDFNYAQVSFQMAVNLAPNNYFHHNNLGAAYLEMKMYREALKCFEKSVRINWDYHNGWDNIWSTRNKLGWASRRGEKSISYFISGKDDGQIKRDAEMRKRAEEKRRKEAERKRKEAEKRRKDDAEKLRKDEARKKAEAEKLRKEQELKKQAEKEKARKRLEEQKRKEAARKKAEAERIKRLNKSSSSSASSSSKSSKPKVLPKKSSSSSSKKSNTSSGKSANQ